MILSGTSRVTNSRSAVSSSVHLVDSHRLRSVSPRGHTFATFLCLSAFKKPTLLVLPADGLCANLGIDNCVFAVLLTLSHKFPRARPCEY